ncbi:ATPase inhibitor [Penicillium atrosanguineum]|uniref:ATPase inhibitor, mitochondrial n=1 Tax=Penicillium atrosanguineum TaxID=1132637 RepID=A0A9W9PR99_9EURO|nr:fungal-specific transcription factor domain-containing protein [Penicillium atrosanguineum]KAJ5132089.1 ATPase inhibitor [Penicillium atrosanguineum]KAJ5137701.1 ATPase inhibitor [Penicillium atrosanguineum]KAJ5289756.1 fungal-specific transcription factor domain-containing protein [Penicillium atrosanguineum]KAJ5307577.1 ATPase inhibitor [Penicillium atrosanguineum]
MQALSPVKRALPSHIITRYFSVSSSIMGEGDTGAPKPRGFLAEKDTFTQRGAAQEGMYIKEQEMEKMRLLREKLRESQKHMEELDKHLEEYAKTQGGEQG